MITDLEQQFIAVVASALYDEREPQISRCGWCAFTAAANETHDAYVIRERISEHEFSPRREGEDDPTPAGYNLLAGIFLGALLQANQTTLNEIVNAARDTFYRDPPAKDYRRKWSLATFFRALITTSLSPPVKERCPRCKAPGPELAHYDDCVWTCEIHHLVEIHGRELVVPTFTTRREVSS